MNLDSAGLALIKSFEGCCLAAYQDKASVWTIGWGSTRYANGAPVKAGDKLVNVECAGDLLLHTLAPLTQNQFNALVDFEYNEGAGALGESHLLVKLNAGDYAGAADEFLKWDEITNPETHQKEVLNDLYTRRKKEQALFLKP
jgi:lysozyme